MADLSRGVSWRLGPQREGFARCYLRDNEFDAALDRAGLGPDIERLFERTKPRWYGLWLGGPLNDAQCRVLIELFTAAGLSSGEQEAEWDITVPLRRALAEGIPLEVEVPAPGHVDMGFVTTYVHCPRCKCEGPFPRWQESYPADIQFCECCGQAYSPASTYSSVWEYSLHSFECTQCGQVVKGRTLSDGQLQILEEHDLHEDQVKEFDWLERVAAFYARYPHTATYYESRGPFINKDDSVTFGSSVRFSPDDVSAAGQEQWRAENAAVMEYLEQHIFSLEHRRRSIMQSLNSWSLEEHPTVHCKECGGELRRVR